MIKFQFLTYHYKRLIDALGNCVSALIWSLVL